jgi:hypothetical protein
VTITAFRVFEAAAVQRKAVIVTDFAVVGGGLKDSGGVQRVLQT